MLPNGPSFDIDTFRGRNARGHDESGSGKDLSEGGERIQRISNGTASESTVTLVNHRVKDHAAEYVR